jgi:hypothetical protein
MKSNICKIEEYTKLKTFNKVGENLKYALDNVKIEGDFLEFGVFQGRSINIIAEKFPDQKIYGFDSFKGLPEDWVVSKNNTYEKGRFSLGDDLPDVRDNVELVVGWFNDTLENWIESNNNSVSFLHIDCDLYSSASYVLKTLNEKIKVGTIIVFDELLNFESNVGIDYEFWENGEWKALNEWMNDFDRDVKPISRDISTRVSFEVVK